ncbi:MAG: serine hydrolase domain-containing protein [Lawsonibacter sp.]|nr:serine hydrolase domain-containing protein [Lawsonibacter sp.]
MEKIYPTSRQAEQIVELENDLEQILHDPVMPVAGYGVMVFRDGKLLYQGCGGFRRFSPPLAFDSDTRFRTASISKVFSAVGVMRLVEQGVLSLDEDVSRYLDFTLRNPSYPERPITLRMLMSHTSSIRDGNVYSIPPEDNIQQFFLPNGKYYADGKHFANSADGVDRAPGYFFAYTNLNYGIIGTIFERLSGLRFDEYMKKNVLEPMGIGASFNVGDFSVEELHHFSPLYQSKNGDCWDAFQPWAAQIDDYQDQPQSRHKVLITNPDLGGQNVMADLAHYHVGDNGTLFSPQGGLRISMNEMTALAELFLTDGYIGGKQFLHKESVDTLFTPYWTYDPTAPNGDTYDGLMTCYGLGIQTMQSKGRDRFLKNRNVVLSGHFGEAYGLLAGLFLDRARKCGFFYVINGQGAPDSDHHGDYSGMYQWEEHLSTALLDNLFPEL